MGVDETDAPVGGWLVVAVFHTLWSSGSIKVIDILSFIDYLCSYYFIYPLMMMIGNDDDDYRVNDDDVIIVMITMMIFIVMTITKKTDITIFKLLIEMKMEIIA